MKRPGRSIRWNLLAGISGVVLLVVVVITLGVSQVVESRIRADIVRRFEETGRIFERIQEIRFRLLYQTAILMADVPNLKGAVSTNDVPTVTVTVRNELAPLLDFDPVLADSVLAEAGFDHPDSLGILLILDRNGYVLGNLGSGALPEHSLADRPGVAEALAGGYPDRIELWEEGGRYFNVVTVPIWLGDSIMGSLSFGYPIRRLEAEQLAADTGTEVGYYIGNRMWVDSYRLDAAAEELLARAAHEATFDVTATGAAALKETHVAGTDWILYVTPMLPVETMRSSLAGYYVVVGSLTQALQPVRDLQRFTLWFGLIALLVAVGLAVALTNRITKPVGLLLEGIRRMEAGEYDREVPVVTNDELRLLTETFNRLVVTVRERVEMLKFVSAATLDAITRNATSVEKGGTRKRVTVFFSDVRGFTRWSEQRDPEAVIAMLNQCLRFQADIVADCGGDVDKFVGDELVAVFEGEEAESRAVHAARRIMASMHTVMGHEPDIRIGIGLHAGEVVMGAVGSADRMDYTVIGNHVNIGARLCSAAAPGQILASVAVVERLERRIPVKPLEPILVKGIADPIPIFSIEPES